AAIPATARGRGRPGARPHPGAARPAAQPTGPAPCHERDHSTRALPPLRRGLRARRGPPRSDRRALLPAHVPVADQAVPDTATYTTTIYTFATPPRREGRTEPTETRPHRDP